MGFCEVFRFAIKDAKSDKSATLVSAFLKKLMKDWLTFRVGYFD